ncbi:MAG: wyosine [tRNA(Phe)-imidazoG37] synthetase (radical SAM superfamily) [Planctomycetota bacterium]|jgi:wyosine [tRNA(Phe)-imidazoG37] synthetase (radical SAM superfamily)
MLPIQDELVRGPERVGALGPTLIIEPTCTTHRKDTFPSQAVVITTAARRMIELSKGGEKVKHIVVHGSPDPTLHPDFRAISENLRELTNKWFPRAKLTLLSDARHLDQTEVRISLGSYHKPSMRLDAGNQKTYKSLSGAKASEFKDVVNRLIKLEMERLLLHTRFVKGSVDNTTDSELKGWLKYVVDIRPAAVQIFTVSKAETTANLKPVTKARLEKIAAEVAELGITCEVVI